MNRTSLVLAALLIGVVMTSGCYSHTYRTGPRPARAEADYHAWQNHIIAGLVTLSDDVSLQAICPNGAAVIHNRVTFVNGLVGAITLGIYTPTTVRIWCAGERGQAELHEVEIDISKGLIEKARLIVPDFDEQVLALHDELNATRVADAGADTATF